jgi:hypothetical protein
MSREGKVRTRLTVRAGEQTDNGQSVSPCHGVGSWLTHTFGSFAGTERLVKVTSPRVNLGQGRYLPAMQQLIAQSDPIAAVANSRIDRGRDDPSRAGALRSHTPHPSPASGGEGDHRSSGRTSISDGQELDEIQARAQAELAVDTV